jgi:tRNA G18 (ribose-2'-O)-methylase SpoU
LVRELVQRFRNARRDPALAVLEGFHPLKHALRFDASVARCVTRDVRGLLELCGELAPDLVDKIERVTHEVPGAVFDELAPLPPDTGVIAIAMRPAVSAQRALSDEERGAPLVLLEGPAHRGNVGAVIRASASAGASAVVTTGTLDPWDPAVIRGSAGLHYAIDVSRVEELGDVRGPLIALDPEGEALVPGSVPSNAVLAFGSERRGLSDALLSRADRRVAIPMQAGVSSMNLATAVAVVLYAWRLAADHKGTKASA